MKIEVCDMCKTVLTDEYYHIPVLRADVRNPGWGKMVLRIGGSRLCKSCAFGIAGVCNGDEEIKYARKHSSDIDRNAIIRLHKEGKQTKEISTELGYSESTVRRVVAAYKEKAAPK